MPKGVKPPASFHGVKGRSGRKIFPVEQAKIQSIHNAWNIVNQDLETKKDIKTALPIALRDMDEKVKHSGEIVIEFVKYNKDENNTATPLQTP